MNKEFKELSKKIGNFINLKMNELDDPSEAFPLIAELSKITDNPENASNDFIDKIKVFLNRFHDDEAKKLTEEVSGINIDSLNDKLNDFDLEKSFDTIEKIDGFILSNYAELIKYYSGNKKLEPQAKKIINDLIESKKDSEIERLLSLSEKDGFYFVTSEIDCFFNKISLKENSKKNINIERILFDARFNAFRQGPKVINDYLIKLKDYGVSENEIKNIAELVSNKHHESIIKEIIKPLISKNNITFDDIVSETIKNSDLILDDKISLVINMICKNFKIKKNIEDIESYLSNKNSTSFMNTLDKILSDIDSNPEFTKKLDSINEIFGGLFKYFKFGGVAGKPTFNNSREFDVKDYNVYFYAPKKELKFDNKNSNYDKIIGPYNIKELLDDIKNKVIDPISKGNLAPSVFVYNQNGKIKVNVDQATFESYSVQVIRLISNYYASNKANSKVDTKTLDDTLLALNDSKNKNVSAHQILDNYNLKSTAEIKVPDELISQNNNYSAKKILDADKNTFDKIIEKAKKDMQILDNDTKAVNDAIKNANILKTPDYNKAEEITKVIKEIDDYLIKTGLAKKK